MGQQLHLKWPKVEKPAEEEEETPKPKKHHSSADHMSVGQYSEPQRYTVKVQGVTVLALGSKKCAEFVMESYPGSVMELTPESIWQRPFTS